MNLEYDMLTDRQQIRCKTVSIRQIGLKYQVRTGTFFFRF